MKLNQFMPFYGSDYFEAMAGYSDAVSMAYLRAIWHYWSHAACEGLPDDSEYLRRVCCIGPGEWDAVRAVVFDNRYHFRLLDGQWHNKRAMAEYQKAKRVTAARSLGGRKAMGRRWAGDDGSGGDGLTHG